MYLRVTDANTLARTGEVPSAEDIPLIDVLLATYEEVLAHAGRIYGTVLGQLVEVGEHGEVFVVVPGVSENPLLARSLCSVDCSQIGAECAVTFVAGDPSRPLITGVLNESSTPGTARTTPGSKFPDAIVDGRQITFDAQEKMVLRCGDASITLTRAGKILIEGEHLLARAMGANRIQGGFLQFN